MKTILGFLFSLSFWPGLLNSAENATELPDRVVEMPPFIVTHEAPPSGWRYATVPGFEILSQCSDREAREIVAALSRGPQLVLPASMRTRFSVPMTVLLFNEPSETAGNPNSLGSVRAQGEIRTHWTNVIKRTTEDRESFAVNLWGSRFTSTPAFRFDLRTALWRRTPAVPNWLNEGLFGRYGVHREGVYWDEAKRQKRVHVAAWWSENELARAVRAAKAAARQQRSSDPNSTPSPVEGLIPQLSTLFQDPPPPLDGPDAARWACAAALFVRWGAFSPEAALREKFWKFAERASNVPVTENLFREYFGRSYAEVHYALGWYLPLALTREASAPVDLPVIPPVEFRQARHVEVARLYGEWQRIEAKSLEADFPDLARAYLTEAERNLNRALTFKHHARDPRVLASLGLVALQGNQLMKANDWLEAAVTSLAIGPLVYLEAARLRWARLLKNERGILDESNRAAVVDLLLVAEAQQPTLPSVYRLLANLAEQGPLPMRTVEIAALKRGMERFPRDPEIQRRLSLALAPTEALRSPAATP